MNKVTYLCDLKEKTMHIPKEQRKNILFISDSILGFSGVANVAKSIIQNTAHHYNYINLGLSLIPDHKGKAWNLSESVNQHLGIKDAHVFVFEWPEYDDVELIRDIVKKENIHAIVYITDPRFYQRLFQAEYEFRTNGVKMVYVSVWDNFPLPRWNRPGWLGNDMSLCISKQTLAMNKMLLGEDANKVILKYFPHGTDIDTFKPLPTEATEAFKKDILKGKEADFILFFNSRNIRRKNIQDTILAFKLFTSKLPKDKADRCFFILHTQKVDNNGTDLIASTEILANDIKEQIIFDDVVCTAQDLNLRYNIASATIQLSVAEGFGIAGIESMAAGTPIICTVTGGMQDYMRFEDEDGNWFTPNKKVWSNHNGTYKKCGEWAYPVYPSVNNLLGSPATPTIFEDYIDFRDAADVIMQVYNERGQLKDKGIKGREFLQGESRMTDRHMSEDFISNMEYMFANAPERPRYTITRVDKPIETRYTPIPDYLFQ